MKTDKHEEPTTDESNTEDHSTLETPTDDLALNQEEMIDTQDPNEPDQSDFDASPKQAIQIAFEGMQAELAETKDQLLRAHAEIQNIKRRSENDLEKAHKFGLERFAESLLPIIDSLERGIMIEDGNQESNAIKEGMSLTLKLFTDTLKKFNIETISPEGEPFDPQFHQAISQIASESVEPGSVIEVFQKGYTLNKRLIRPAMVIVSK